MANKNNPNMAGMGNMPGMSMGDTPRQGANTDPTKNQKGMDTSAPSVQSPGPIMHESMLNMPMAEPSRVWTVTGTEDWTMLSGFGPASGMVTMMNEMMVAGSAMQSMKMGKMDMRMAEMRAPTPEQARTQTAAVPVEKSPSEENSADQQPGPTAPPQAAPPGIALKTDETLVATAVIAPNPPAVGGGNVITVTVADSAGKAVAGASVTSTVAMTTMDMGTTHPTFQDIGNGRYRGKVGFSMAGPWRVSLHVTMAGRKSVLSNYVFNVK